MSNSVSKRKACQYVGVTHSSIALPLRDKGDDRMKKPIMAIWRPNMGYRMLHSLLLKVFPEINIKRTYRLCKELRLGRVRRYRKKRTGTPVPYVATMPNDVWTMDIIHDSCMNGARLRILSIIDAFTRECLALEVSTRVN
jgi:putative transposase